MGRCQRYFSVLYVVLVQAEKIFSLKLGRRIDCKLLDFARVNKERVALKLSSNAFVLQKGSANRN